MIETMNECGWFDIRLHLHDVHFFHDFADDPGRTHESCKVGGRVGNTSHAHSRLETASFFGNTLSSMYLPRSFILDDSLYLVEAII